MRQPPLATGYSTDLTSFLSNGPQSLFYKILSLLLYFASSMSLWLCPPHYRTVLVTRLLSKRLLVTQFLLTVLFFFLCLLETLPGTVSATELSTGSSTRAGTCTWRKRRAFSPALSAPSRARWPLHPAVARERPLLPNVDPYHKLCRLPSLPLCHPRTAREDGHVSTARESPPSSATVPKEII